MTDTVSDRQTDITQTDGQTDRHTDGQTDIRQKDRQTSDRRTDRQTSDRRTSDRQTDRQTSDRRTDRHRETLLSDYRLVLVRLREMKTTAEEELSSSESVRTGHTGTQTPPLALRLSHCSIFSPPGLIVVRVIMKHL